MVPHISLYNYYVNFGGLMGIMLANGKIWINCFDDKDGLRIFAINN